MTDFQNLLRAIEEEPSNDGLWLIFADWLEEQGDPIADLLRKKVERKRLQECFGPIARKLSFRKLQLFACDCVESLLPIYEHQYPDDFRPRQLLEALRGDSPKEIPRSIQQSLFESRIARMHEGLTSQNWLARCVSDCFENLVENPERCCVLATNALAFEKVGIEALAGLTRKDKIAERAAMQVEFRLLVARTLRCYLKARDSEPAQP